MLCLSGFELYSRWVLLLLQVKANLCKCNNLGGYFYADTKSLEQELMKFLVQKGKIPYGWQEALISTSAVSIMYYTMYNMHLIRLGEEQCFVKMSMQITGCY